VLCCHVTTQHKIHIADVDRVGLSILYSPGDNEVMSVFQLFYWTAGIYSYITFEVNVTACDLENSFIIDKEASTLIETMRLSRTVFELLLLISQNLKKSPDHDHAHSRDSL